MEIINKDDVYKKESMYSKKFMDNLFEEIKEDTKFEPHYVIFSESTIRERLNINKNTNLESIYRRLRIILVNSDIKISLRKHADGFRVFVFCSKQ